MIEIVLEKRPPDVSEYLKLRAAVGWQTTPELATETALAGALFSVCVMHGGEIVGMGRIVGDRGLYYYVQDVIVMPPYQRQGIGTRIMEEITAYLDEHAVDQAFIGLKAGKNLIPFYERFGFSSREEDIPGVFMVRG